MVRTTVAPRSRVRSSPGPCSLPRWSRQPARAQNALGYFKNYFVTGDYLAVGVGLQHTA